MTELDETRSVPQDEYLDRLCWLTAVKAERFFPPEETAKSCMESVEDRYEKNDNMDYDEGLAWEEGTHTRAVMDAVNLFEDMHTRGYEPKKRAKRYVEKKRAAGINLTGIDWEWHDRMVSTEDTK